jgi:hypothetical protein
MQGLSAAVAQIPEDDRFSWIMKKAQAQIEESLEKMKLIYENATEGLLYFQKIHKVLWKDELDRKTKVAKIGEIFESIWNRVLEIKPDYVKKIKKKFPFFDKDAILENIRGVYPVMGSISSQIVFPLRFSCPV